MPLGLRITRQQVAYFPVQQPALYDPNNCPVYIFAAEPNLYGFPMQEFPGHIKIALENESHTTDPDQPRQVMEENIRSLGAAVAEHHVQQLLAMMRTGAYVARSSQLLRRSW